MLAFLLYNMTMTQHQLTGNIFLVGPMGAGKTSVGVRLAKALGRSFYDSDHEIESQTGVSISWIFAKEGEAGFRKREQEMIAKLSMQKNIVLATGGGAVLSAANRKKLKAHGTVVYLSATPLQLLRRTKGDTKRPLLQSANPLATIEALLKIRDPLYREVADVVVISGSQSLARGVQHILKTLATQESNI